MAHRVAPRVEVDLDDIWLYVAVESGSLEIATRLIDTITQRFLLLGSFPAAGRSRDGDFGSASRSFPVGEYLIIYQVDVTDVLILRVVHGRRDLEGIF